MNWQLRYQARVFVCNFFPTCFSIKFSRRACLTFQYLCDQKDSLRFYLAFHSARTWRKQLSTIRSIPCPASRFRARFADVLSVSSRRVSNCHVSRFQCRGDFSPLFNSFFSPCSNGGNAIYFGLAVTCGVRSVSFGNGSERPRAGMSKVICALRVEFQPVRFLPILVAGLELCAATSRTFARYRRALSRKLLIARRWQFRSKRCKCRARSLTVFSRSNASRIFRSAALCCQQNGAAFICCRTLGGGARARVAWLHLA